MAKGKKRKWWIIPVVVIGVLLLLALASPFALLKYVNTPAGASNISQIASSYLNADVRVEKIQLNILKTKPNLCIVIENADVFSHVFVEDNSDTLLHFDHLSLSVNYMKYLKEGKVLVNYLDLEHPKVGVRVDSLGKANYQIYESKDTTPSDFTLPEIFLTNGQIKAIKALYVDERLKFRAEVDSADFTASGNVLDSLYAVEAKLKVKAATYGDTTLQLNELPILVDAKLAANTDFTSIEVEQLQLNSEDILDISLVGNANQLPDSSWNTNIDLSALLPDLQSILDIVPEKFLADWPAFTLGGMAQMDAHVEGIYKDTIYPSVSAEMALKDIVAQRLDKKDAICFDMQMDAKYDADQIENTYVNVSHLEATLGKTYLDLKGNATNVLQNPNVDAKLKCNMDLNYISQYIPLDKIKYNGAFSADVKTKFKYNDLKKFDVEKIYLLGNMDVKRVFVSIPSQRFLLLSRNMTIDAGTNSIKSRWTGDEHLAKAEVNMDTMRLKYKRLVETTVSNMKLSASVNKDEQQPKIPRLMVTVSANNMQAIVNDTLFVKGRKCRLSAALAKDKDNDKIPCMTVFVNMDSVIYFDPVQGAFCDSTYFVLKGKPRVRRRGNDSTYLAHQKVITIDSLVNMVKKVNNAEDVLKRFDISGGINMKLARAMSPYFPLRMVARHLNVSFNSDTVVLNQFRLLVGHSFMTVSGTVDNIRRAILRNEVLNADVKIASRRIDVNELLYAQYQGELEKEKDAIAKTSLHNSFEQMRQDTNRRPLMLDTAKRREIMRRNAGRSLEDIYSERMSRMDSLMTSAYNKELATTEEQDEADSSGEEYDLDTIPMSLFVVPSNINGKINLLLDTLKFSSLVMTDFRGNLIANSNTLQIQNLNTNSNAGSMCLNMMYHCKDASIAQAGLDLLGTDIYIEKLLSAFPFLDTIMPMLSSFEGTLDCELSAVSDFDSQWMPILPSLNAACYLRGKDLVLLDGETFSEVAKMLMFKKKTKNIIDQMAVEFTIADNKLNILPFSLAMDKYKVAVSGNMTFDLDCYYHISVLKSPIIFDFGIDVLGTIGNFKFKLVKPKYKDENAIVRSVDLTNKTEEGRINMQKSLQKLIQNAIDTYKQQRTRTQSSSLRRSPMILNSIVNPRQESSQEDQQNNTSEENNN